MIIYLLMIDFLKSLTDPDIKIYLKINEHIRVYNGKQICKWKI
jgi:hypothetical protein